MDQREIELKQYTVVLLGDSDSGKSAIIDNLTARKSEISASSQSETRSTEAFESWDGSLLFVDTPDIKSALSDQPNAGILIVVKADDQMDHVVKRVTQHVERALESISPDLIRVCVTNIDNVNWNANELQQTLELEFQIKEVSVFSSMETLARDLRVSFLTEYRHKAPPKSNILADPEKPYIVLLGDVGSGKSTIVEKLTGKKGRSSAGSHSETLTEEVFESYDGSFLIADTPGSNSITDKFKHSRHIARAMNVKPITCVLIVAKADNRIDNVIENVCGYAQGFIPEDFPAELIGVCVTHMDTVSWSEHEMLKHLQLELGIERATFCSIKTSQVDLRNSLMEECCQRKPFTIHVDREVFLRLFNIENTNVKAMTETRREVRKFEKMTEDFELQRKFFDNADQMDLVFEFMACMSDEQAESQKELSENNCFEQSGGLVSASAAGHIADLKNQIEKVLGNLSAEIKKYRTDCQTCVRKCYYCSCPWYEGKESDSFDCGGASDDSQSAVKRIECRSWRMANFEFIWDLSSEKLTVEKVSSKSSAADRFTCGNKIKWALMPPYFFGSQGKAEASNMVSFSGGRHSLPLNDICRVDDNNGSFDEFRLRRPNIGSVTQLDGLPDYRQSFLTSSYANPHEFERHAEVNNYVRPRLPPDNHRQTDTIARFSELKLNNSYVQRQTANTISINNSVQNNQNPGYEQNYYHQNLRDRALGPVGLPTEQLRPASK